LPKRAKSFVKRSLHGTYLSVEPFHLFRYLDEQSCRFINRRMTDAERFDLAVHAIVGKLVMFDQLTGKIRPAPTDNSKAAVA
jgi:hypothetical protein